jgi:hypothetical protein
LRFTTFMAAALGAAIPALVAAAGADEPPAVSRPIYRSVFGANPAGVEEGTIGWRDANAAVAEFPRGHADLLKWEERQGAPAAGASVAPLPAAKPARPAASGAAHPHQH